MGERRTHARAFRGKLRIDELAVEPLAQPLNNVVQDIFSSNFLPRPAADMREGTNLVLLHGLASTPSEFGLIQHPLRRLRTKLHTPTIRGYTHGSTSAHVGWQDWVKAADEAVRLCVGSQQPYVLGGLCTGALLALAVAAGRDDPLLAGIALLSPTFAYDGWGLPRWYRLRSLAYALGVEGHFAMSERPPYGLKNERLRQWIRQQLAGPEATLVGPASISLRLVRESERLAKTGSRWLQHLDVPVLVLHARDDEISSLQSVQTALSKAPNSKIELAILENSYHMITADNDRQIVVQRLATHTDRCVRLASHRVAHAAASIDECESHARTRSP